MIALVVQLNLPLPKCNTIQYKESYHSHYQQHSSTQNTRECAGTAMPIVILYLWYADGCRIMLTQDVNKPYNIEYLIEKSLHNV